MTTCEIIEQCAGGMRGIGATWFAGCLYEIFGGVWSYTDYCMDNLGITRGLNGTSCWSCCRDWSILNIFNGNPDWEIPLFRLDKSHICTLRNTSCSVH